MTKLKKYLKFVIVFALLVGAYALYRYKSYEAPLKTPDTLLVQESTKSQDTSVFNTLAKPDVGQPYHLTVRGGLISTNLVSVGKDKDGYMETPKDWNSAGWYRLGSKTAEEGNIIINGHYDDNFGRPAAFWQLKTVKIGDKITLVDEFNRPFDYQVTEVYYLAIDDPDRFKIFGYEEGTQNITLITCGGVWIPTEATYNKRLIVRAVRTN